MIYTVFSIIAIVLMAALVGYVCFKLFISNRKTKVHFIKNFKKGRFAVIYIVSIPLFIMTLYYAGESFGIAFLKSITYSINLVVLKFDQDIVLADVNLAFKIAIYLCYALVLCNAILFACSCLGQIIVNAFKKLGFTASNKSKCLLVGYNQENIDICHSSIKQAKSMIVDTMSKENIENLYIENCCYKGCNGSDHVFKYIEKKILKVANKAKKGKDYKLTVILNNTIEKEDLELCAKLVKTIKNVKELIDPKTNPQNWYKFLANINIFVFGLDEFEDIYIQYNHESERAIKYLNKQKQVSIDFILRYPLTEYMGKNILDTNTGLIDKDSQINVTLVGFGQTNQQMFLSMLENNQFASKDAKGKLINHPVNFHIFDKEQFDIHKRLNDTYYRFKVLFNDKETRIINPKDYLELPPLPINEYHHSLNINKIEFYKEIKKTIAKGSKDLNYIIVSLGNDYTNVEMADKIINRLKEWKNKNTHVFIHINDRNLTKELFPNIPLPLLSKKEKQEKLEKFNHWKNDKVHCFGCETVAIYNFSNIVNDSYYQMAYMSNCIYSLTNENKLDFTEKTILEAKQSWITSDNLLNRDSSIYACLSLRTKLHLLGLDMVKKDDEKHVGISEKEYLQIYAQKFAKNINREADLYKIKMDLSWDNSKRCVIAYLEHNRWLAFQFIKGYVPASKKEILDGIKAIPKRNHGRDDLLRTHGCITTRDGLVELRKMEAKAKKVSEFEADTIKFDYLLMDCAYLLLDKSGYKIIRRD